MRLNPSSCLPFLLTSAAGLSTVNNGTLVDQPDGQRIPTAVRKMSADEGEKFFFDYWGFDIVHGVDNNNIVNTSKATRDLRPPILVHTETDADSLLLAEKYSGSARRALSMLWGRDFKCPTDTSSCSSIGYSDSCCSDYDTCVIVQNTGLGVVGCCPAGETCGDTVSSCATGYTSCSSRLGGGCCIPGYTCVTGGCAYVSTYTVTGHSTTFISSSTVSTVPQVTTSVSTTSSSDTSTSTSTSTSPTSTSSSSSTTSTVSPVPPVRPTTGSQTTVTSTTSSSTSSGVSTCPTGFYACSAVYEGGCCRTGRNCDTTSCPTTSSTTIVNSDGVTIAVPTGSAATTASESGSCATGWFSCAASAGGGCCPSGYACGSSCTASNSGTATATVVKEKPGAAGKYAANVYICWATVLMALVLQFFG